MWQKIFLFILVPVLGLLAINHLFFEKNGFIRYLLAAAPIVIVLVLMIIFHLGGHYAGLIGLAVGIWIAFVEFGFTPEVLWVSQLKGLRLTVFVLAVFWPALFLYNIVNRAGGIHSIAQALQNLITDRAVLLIVIAWAFSAMLEGLAGFGLPVAIVSPMLVGLGVAPVMAVTAVAVGHAWSVTFGDMGVVFQTLISVVHQDSTNLASQSAILLGIACLVCGFATAKIFSTTHRWPAIMFIGLVMSTVQYFSAISHLNAMAGFFAGLSGVIAGILVNRFVARKPVSFPGMSPGLKAAFIAYGSLAVLMSFVTLIPAVYSTLAKMIWQVSYPQVQTLDGFTTVAVPAQIYRPLLHPGTSIMLVALLSYVYNRINRLYPKPNIYQIAKTTFTSAWPAMVGIFSMVGLSAVMDHSGMTIQLAEALATVFGLALPIVSPLLGVIGAFATGSNNNSNVLFGSLQEGIAQILQYSPLLIVAAQTTGGALGSMVAPAKIIVGCSTVNLQGHEGEVLKKTLPYGIGIALLIGLVTFLLLIVK